MAENEHANHESTLYETIRIKEKRKMRARRHRKESIWFGLGMFGVIGWSVAVPMLVGIAIGIWIDARYKTDMSWTLMLMITGVFIGSANAWYWIQREERNIRQEREENEDKE